MITIPGHFRNIRILDYKLFCSGKESKNFKTIFVFLFSIQLYFIWLKLMMVASKLFKKLFCCVVRLNLYFYFVLFLRFVRVITIYTSIAKNTLLWFFVKCFVYAGYIKNDRIVKMWFHYNCIQHFFHTTCWSVKLNNISFWCTCALWFP